MAGRQDLAGSGLARNHGPALGLGLAAGMRSMTPVAAVAMRSSRAPFPLRAALVAAAAGELIVDKAPFTPSRTDAGPLLGRVASGAGAGWIAGGPQGSLLGGAAAAASAFTMEALRAAMSEGPDLPDAAIAIAEDVIAVGLAWAASTRLEG